MSSIKSDTKITKRQAITPANDPAGPTSGRDGTKIADAKFPGNTRENVNNSNADSARKLLEVTQISYVQKNGEEERDEPRMDEKGHPEPVDLVRHFGVEEL